ncbi:MAG: YHS domain-containing (seleno)protein [Myxococcaceae bacterium]|nr:YHS domain-containing (seleno)protein [Myxococcaceae bacterium]
MHRFTLAALVVSSAVTAFADGSKVKLGGYCPVAYVSANKALPGDLKVTSEVDGRVYAFINEGAKKAFDADPQKFTSAIQYDAWCATGLATGKRIPSDPALFSVVDGKVYLFSSKGAKDTFDKAPKELVAKADAQAKKLLAD